MNRDKENRSQKTGYNTQFSFLCCSSRALWIIAAILFQVLVATTSARAGNESLPHPAICSGFGVNILFTGEPHDLDMIAATGFKFIRMDLVWSGIERVKGAYDFDTSGYDALTRGCVKRGIQIPYILDYNNKLYESDRSVSGMIGRTMVRIRMKESINSARYVTT
jgi:hypothetical protein